MYWLFVLIMHQETIMKSYQEKKASMSKLTSLNIEKSKQNVAKEMGINRELVITNRSRRERIKR